MSSYLHSNNHFNSAEQATVAFFALPDVHVYRFKEKFPELYHTRKDKEAVVSIGKIFNNIRILSALCVTYQYKNHYGDKVEEMIKQDTIDLLADTKTHIKLKAIDLHKALSSIDYQIEIEHLKEVRKLTEDENNALWFLDELQECIADYIVCRLPEYESSSAWSID